MGKIFITGSADGLGLMAAQQLLAEGHEVVTHARNADRASTIRKIIPTAETLFADLTDLDACKQLAADANAKGPFDTVIHNAGVYQVSNKDVFAVNTLAPYILTCLIAKPKRLIYLSSGMHLQGDANGVERLSVQNGASYSDTKLHVTMIAFAVARLWPSVFSNAVDPGWVPTKMGGKGAPDNLQMGFQTQAWLATSDDQQAKVSGKYFYHKKQKAHHRQADNIELQDQLMARLEKICGVQLPKK